MGLFNRKNQLQRVIESVSDSLDEGLPNMGSGKALKRGLIAAGGLAGITAGSAGISSLRRQREGARDDS